MTAALSIQNLAKSYGRVQAIRDISFEVAAGEVFGLLGPNGAGKTSTVECIIGLRRPDAGRIAIMGIDALAEPGRVRALMGAQLQFTALQEKITPRQALRFFASFYPRSADIGALIEQFDLSEKADRPFDTLSGGQRQRLAVALALVHEPRVIFLDEPTAGLDPLARRELLEMIGRLKQTGIAILLTTHQIEDAQRLCDRVAILREGRMMAVGSPAALIAGSKVVPWILVRAKRELTREQLMVEGVTSCGLTEGRWRLESSQVTRTIEGLVRLMESEGNELLELEIRHPTLEDVVLDLTGAPRGPQIPAVG